MRFNTSFRLNARCLCPRMQHVTVSSSVPDTVLRHGPQEFRCLSANGKYSVAGEGHLVDS